MYGCPNRIYDMSLLPSLPYKQADIIAYIGTCVHLCKVVLITNMSHVVLMTYMAGCPNDIYII